MDFDDGNDALKVALVVIVILGVSGYALSSGFVRLPRFKFGCIGICPGFQGMQNGLYGYGVNGQPAVSLGNTLPTPANSCGYSWVGSPTIGSASVMNTAKGGFGIGCIFGGSHQDTLTLDAQTNAVSNSNPFTTGQKVDYVIKNPSGSGSLHVSGQVNVYTYSVDFSINSGSAGNWNFAGDTVWYNLYSQTWNQFSTDPSNSTIPGNAWEAPLYAVVSNVQWCTTISSGVSYNCNQGSNNLDASVVGHPLSFYGSPSTTGQTLATLAGKSFSPGVDVNQSLSSVYAPDTRLSRLVYYPISVTSFGANPSLGGDCTLGCTYPSVTVTFTLYTLQIGEYVLTNPSQTGLGSRTQGCTGVGCIAQTIGNLFNYAGANALWLGLLASVGVVLAVLIVLAVFAGPVLLAVIFYFSRRREDG